MKPLFPIAGALALAVCLFGQAPPPPPTKAAIDHSIEQSLQKYQEALDAVNQMDWAKVEAQMAAAQKALQSFDSKKAEGALYWQAYAASKLGERDKAMAKLQALRKAYPDGSWSQDAGALWLQLQPPGLPPMPPIPPMAAVPDGWSTSPALRKGDDLKLLALNGLMNTEPSKALPLLKDVINGGADATVKDRALFVLAQSHTPEALAYLVDAAEHNSDPAVRLHALRYLGLFGGEQSQAALAQIYHQSNSTEVKQNILRDFMLSGDTTRLVALAKSESNPQLRDQAIRELGLSGKPEAQTALLDMYRGARDRAGSEAIIQALFLHNSAPALVSLARKETDPELKRDIVQRLSLMHSPAATAYLIELLKQ